MHASATRLVGRFKVFIADDWSDREVVIVY
jgi:hypothetical protein